MEKIFDKLGLYDIWTVLFPGVIFLIGVRSLYDFMISLSGLLSTTPGMAGKLGLILRMDITTPSDIYELLVLLALSYLCGLILHELSSILKHKVVYQKGDPRALLLDGTAGILNSQELRRLMPLLKSLNNGRDFSQSEPEKLRDESKFLFHRMNKSLQDKKKSGDYVKLNIIYNMCGTLCIVLALLSLITLAFGVDFFFHKEYFAVFYSLMILGMMVVLFLILLFRSKRYYRYWVRNIVFAYEELYWNNNGNSMEHIPLGQQKSEATQR